MSVMRSVKNIVNNYTDAEVKVREATSNDPWGPSSTLMAEIADLTYNVVAFTEIMQMIWKRLNDHGKNWRHVYKALTLLEYIIKTGSEKVSQQCKENVFAIQTLKDFQYAEEGKDHGVNVREKAKALVSLLKDDDRLKNERAKALKAKERLSQSAFGIGSEGAQTHFGGKSGSKFGSGSLRTSDSFGSASPEPSSGQRRGVPPATELEEARPSSAGEEELQLQLALAMSKEEAEAEEKRRRQDDLKLQMALEESRKENTAGSAPGAAGQLLLLGAPGSSASFRAGLPATSGTVLENTAAAERRRRQEQRGSKLLDLDLPTPKTKLDPWAAVSVSTLPPTLQQSDPFQPPSTTAGAPSAPPATDPWGTPMVTAAPQATSTVYPAQGAATFDPWAPPKPPAAQSALPGVPATARDPWSTPAAPALPAKAGNSPWDPPQSTGAQTNGNASSTPPDEFEFVIKRTAPTTSTASSSASSGKANGSSAATFDLGDMSQALPSDRKAKNAEDFLGPNAKLVNLDSLVTKAHPAVAPANPFALSASSTAQQPLSAAAPVGGLGFASATMSNPFAGQVQRPSLNQMSTSTSFGPLPHAQVGLLPGGQQHALMGMAVGGSGGGAVMPPGYAAMPSYQPVYMAAPQQASHNPFL